MFSLKNFIRDLKEIEKFQILKEKFKLLRVFKAFIFSIRSNVYNYAPTSWSIMEEPEASWLGELVAEPASIFDGL